MSPVFPRSNVALKPAVDSEAIVLHWRRLTFGGVQTRRWYPSFQHLFPWRHKIHIESPNVSTVLGSRWGEDFNFRGIRIVIFRGGDIVGGAPSKCRLRGYFISDLPFPPQPLLLLNSCRN